ncbi:solute carrier family 51 subunit beta [Erpetoichthys calabaricus]|uniref:solute carrier family 51 subunit beta n=1 Tax=Erpetoichthys calabaricus TaxID=27687 RepID=UPI0010A006A7|nr:solute carrier family 51 subunit beta [Erpetoichthys calabaricus]
MATPDPDLILSSLVTVEKDSAEIEYLLWFYRVEDASPWTYAILALCFVSLLVGSLILGIGIMANRNRKSIAKYRSSAGEEKVKMLNQAINGKHPLPSCTEADPADSINMALKANLPDYFTEGNIIIHWKDGNVTSLFTNQSEEAV